MADWSFTTLLRWTAVALCAAAIPLASAQPHAANISFRPHASPFALDQAPRLAGRSEPGPGFYQTAHTDDGQRRGPKGPFARGARRGGRLVAAPSAPPSGFPYRPVSQDARNVPRAQGNATYLRAGSIRDAVTRYNEERDTSRPVARPPAPSSRQPDPSIYRN
ncbi:hypothetical protein GWC77_21995 [Paraburkholderia sp. NMBU_R16]|uniref:hypothetical protein n=1 Tax=Paraburkholderia sp. NMBU_R16 TaxID=2698676 RepID=UPI001566B654|nr:hypothetical protein [Paraburkholderia sp. NMBU_R16]NRO98601.1 hypothetical protein [Paraburkholderia sp. NMBU_R16]